MWYLHLNALANLLDFMLLGTPQTLRLFPLQICLFLSQSASQTSNVSALHPRPECSLLLKINLHHP